jgi:2-polyprenyl-3-methyl-5-hydroxy-6-metoxy-1,4-benzoquinol methylase
MPNSHRVETPSRAPVVVQWDHSSHREFYDYYERESLSPEAIQRFRAIRDRIVRLNGVASKGLSCEVADIGCGAGTQSLLWAKLGCNVHGIDVNEPLLDLARQRSSGEGYCIDFVLGSALSLPWQDDSMDVCLAVELLEHVPDWRTCLLECARVVRPGGVLFLSTTNALCPFQNEFNLPFYSWYPVGLKRYCERLATTTHPRLANYAKYPATNWFTFRQLQHCLDDLGFVSMDRFDLVDGSRKGGVSRVILNSIRTVPFVRWMAHVATPGTTVLAVKAKDANGRAVTTV